MVREGLFRRAAGTAVALLTLMLSGCFGCGARDEWVVLVTVDRGALPVPDRVTVTITHLVDLGGAILTTETRDLPGVDLFTTKGSTNVLVVEPVAAAGAVRVRGEALNEAGDVLGSGVIEAARFAGTASITLLLDGGGSDGGTSPDGGASDAGGGTDGGAATDSGPTAGCGDAICGPTETCATCGADCGTCPPACPDGTCQATETCGTCPADCGACPVVCGDSSCVAPENCATCAADCGICPPSCPNGMCGFGETCSNCPMDCGPCCGNGTCEPALGESCVICTADCGICPTNCSDTLDNDGDALTDWPNDPGCVDIADDDETNPAIVPACFNGGDDDGDALADFPADPGCEDAADDLEQDQCVPGREVGLLPPAGNVTGVTSGPSLMEASCNSGSTTSGPEAVWLVDVPVTATVTFSTQLAGTSLASSLSIRTDCGDVGSEVACGATLALGEVLTIPDLAPGTYYVMIDGQDMASGSYELAVSGLIANGAACDPAYPRFTCAIGAACLVGPGPTGYACEPADCADGLDNDGDAVPDYPADPGCATLSDASEVDPIPLPQCADGADNDGDSLIDWPADTSCDAAGDDDEACAVFAGPDGFGYIGCSEVPSMLPCEDTSTTGTAVILSDDSSVAITLPFTFDFYGTPQTTVSIISNGKLGFPGTTVYANVCSIETYTIALWWDDLYPPSGGTVTYQTFGVAPDRHFTVTYHLPHIAGTWPNIVDVRAVLYEGSGDITVCYADTSFGNVAYDYGVSATMGIKGTPSGLEELLFSCNLPAVSDGLVLKYVHP